MSPSGWEADVAALLDTWCERRALEPLSIVLPRWRHHLQTDEVGYLGAALREVATRDDTEMLARPLPGDERGRLDAAVAAVDAHRSRLGRLLVLFAERGPDPARWGLTPDEAMARVRAPVPLETAPAPEPDHRLHVRLNPDRTGDIGLLLLVFAPTGVVYEHQGAGVENRRLRAEGYLVPLGGPASAIPFQAFFRERLPGGGGLRSDAQVRELVALVAAVPAWRTPADAPYERRFLELDIEHVDGTVEGWVRVLSPLGPGVLVFDNSD
jgi:hypothetical protein